MSSDSTSLVSLINAGPEPVIWSGVFCFSHWQQDVEEADTSAICNRTLVSPRSRPVASRESFLRFLQSLIKGVVSYLECNNMFVTVAEGKHNRRMVLIDVILGFKLLK